jgi:hypothetical protein
MRKKQDKAFLAGAAAIVGDDQLAAAGCEWADDRQRLGLGDLSAPSCRSGGR